MGFAYDIHVGCAAMCVLLADSVLSVWRADADSIEIFTTRPLLPFHGGHV